jgi:multisubunit Na+/H+ antiporter MnhG subunit
MNSLVISIIVPVASFVLIAMFAIVLGFVFYQIHHNTEIGTLGVIGIGLALLILTPAIAFALERTTES